MGKKRGEGKVKEVDPSQTLQGFEWRVTEFMPYTEQDMKGFKSQLDLPYKWISMA